MNRPVSHAAIIWAMIKKDIGEYSRDRLWAFLTAIVLIVVVAMFWILPDNVDESIDLGVSGVPATVAMAPIGLTGSEGLNLVSFDSESDLEAAIAGEATAWQTPDGVVIRADGDTPPGDATRLAVSIGIAFPPDFLEATAAGTRTEVRVYLEGSVPPEVRDVASGMVRELAYGVAGDGLPVDVTDPERSFVVLGTDRAGDQVSARESFRPVFVFLILMMEMFVMASLIAKEIQERTVVAVLVTPATIGDVLVAKGATGALLGLGQAVIVLAAIGAFSAQPLLIFTLMLLGSIMISGTAMIAGSVGSDFISTLFNGMLVMIPLLIPAFAALFPGTASAWVRALPSYPLVEGLIDVSTFGAGWGDVVPQLSALAAWCAVLFGLGWLVLRRKVESL